MYAPFEQDWDWATFSWAESALFFWDSGIFLDNIYQGVGTLCPAPPSQLGSIEPGIGRRSPYPMMRTRVHLPGCRPS